MSASRGSGVLGCLASARVWLPLHQVRAWRRPCGSQADDGCARSRTIRPHPGCALCWRCPAAQCERLPARIRVGEEATVRACWTADASIDTDYTVFVQLIDQRPLARVNGIRTPGWGSTQPAHGSPAMRSAIPMLCPSRPGRRRQFATGSSSACITRRPATGLWLTPWTAFLSILPSWARST